MVKSKSALLFLVLFVFVTSLNFVSAADLTAVMGSNALNYTNMTIQTFVNITISTPVLSNITIINISLHSTFTYINNSNGSGGGKANFSFTNLPGANQNLIWRNITATDTLNSSNSPISFVFNITPALPGEYNFTIVAYNQSESEKSTIRVPITVNFPFAGYVKNESGGNAINVTVEIWHFIQGTAGPPTEILAESINTSSTGMFNFLSVNASTASQYKIKLYYKNASGSVLKTGSILPPFPADILYPTITNETGIQMFMKRPNLNGTTFYIEPAAVINITAVNKSAALIYFGYEVMEQKTGLAIASNLRTSAVEANIVVPLNRQYTIVALRDPASFPMDINCAGDFMNTTTCPSPPNSNSTINPTIAGQVIHTKINLTVTKRYLYGCLEAAGNSTPIRNITAIIPRLIPWTGFVPPGMKMTGINLTDITQLNYSAARCNKKLAYFNISLMNSEYLIEFYGTNTTGSEGIKGESVAALQNISSGTTDINMNITLRPLSGSFTESNVSSLDANATLMKFRIINSSGSLVTSDTPHIEIFIRNSSLFGELHFLVESITNGVFYLPIPSGATAKAKVFPNQAPPFEKNINLSLTETNITLITMTGGDAGFRSTNSTGGFVQINITASPIQMRFLKAGTICDSPNAPTSCEITNMSAANFNPLQALVAGKINMEMSLLGTGVTLTFYNYDMFSAKQPPMYSIMNSQAAGGASTASQMWEFGSFVPADVYDYVTVGIPYTDSAINDSKTVSMSIPVLYDENWNVIWNSTRGDTTANLTSGIDDYLGNANNRSFNSSGYRNFLTSSVSCTENDVNGTSPITYCNINKTSNTVFMRLPHFSGVSQSLSGSAPGTGGTTDSGTTGGSPATITWKTTYAITDAELKAGYTNSLAVKERAKFKINNTDHEIGVVDLTNTTATINVSSIPQTATLNIGDEKKFEITSDNYYDLSVKLNSIANNKANLTIKSVHEEVPAIPPAAEEGEETAGEKITATVKSLFSNIWFWIIILIIILAIVYIVYKKKRYYKKGF